MEKLPYMEKSQKPETESRSNPAPREWEVERMRSSGPGGQHMQKTESKVRVRWNFGESADFTDEEKARLQQAFPKGYIEATSQHSRFQQKNLAIAREKARERAYAALSPVAERIPTGIPRTEKERRLEQKRRVSEKKRLRGGPGKEEEY